MNSWIRALALLLSFVSASTFAQSPAQLIAPDELSQRIEKKQADLVILDVRTAEEFAGGHVPGALNIPHDQLANRVGELADAKHKEIVVYCRSGRRSDLALATLSAQGFKNLRHLDGDMLKWQEQKRPIAK